MESTSPPFFLTVLLTATLLLSISDAQQPLYNFCSNTAGNYTANSTFETNLNRLLSNLSNAFDTGFSNSTVGTPPERVYGLALCRGDASRADCRTCLDTATSDVPNICTYRKTAIAWYDNCLFRYSNQRFLSSMDSGQRVHMWNVNNVTSDERARFNATVWALLGGLGRYAAYNSTTPRMFAAGDMELGGKYPKVYGLVQCTRDITADECNNCLGDIIQDLPQCCNNKVGGRVLAASCNFRYEVYSFSNWSVKLSLPPVSAVETPTPAPSPPPSLPSSPLTPGTNSTNPTSPASSGNKKRTGVVLAITIPIGIASLLLIVIGCFCIQKKRAPKRRQDSGVEDVTIESLLFDLATIKYATNNFSQSNKLGQGGFGSVYKGVLQNGKEIAVKRLSAGSGQGVDELKNEVVLLAKLQHRNLVDLLGVCLEGEEKLLVYEYVANRSLDTILFDPAKKEKLNWERRYNIIRGIAKGMLYLHEESQLRIIHRDLKASNVLLDAELNPKISDFGLARLFGGDQTQASTNRVVGTFGYMSPEYAMRGQFSTKSDVFGFGVLLLEIVTGQKNSDFFQLESSENSSDLLSYVWEKWSHGSIFTILDPSFRGSYSQAEALRCIQIGLLCVQESPTDRPPMSSIVLALNSNTMSINVPAKPAFLPVYSKEQSFRQGLSNDTIEGSTERSIKKSEAFSPNDMSVTELDPR